MTVMAQQSYMAQPTEAEQPIEVETQPAASAIAQLPQLTLHHICHLQHIH